MDRPLTSVKDVQSTIKEVFLENLRLKIRDLEGQESAKLTEIQDPDAIDRFRSRVENRKALLTAVEDLYLLLENDQLNAIEYDI